MDWVNGKRTEGLAGSERDYIKHIFVGYAHIYNVFFFSFKIVLRTPNMSVQFQPSSVGGRLFVSSVVTVTAF